MKYNIKYTTTFTFTEEEVDELGGVEEAIQEAIDQDSCDHSDVDNWEVEEL